MGRGGGGVGVGGLVGRSVGGGGDGVGWAGQGWGWWGGGWCD